MKTSPGTDDIMVKTDDSGLLRLTCKEILNRPMVHLGRAAGYIHLLRVLRSLKVGEGFRVSCMRGSGGSVEESL